MAWINFEYYFFIVLLLWGAALISVYSKMNNASLIRMMPTMFSAGGLVVLGLFIFFLWLKIDRPPMRTLGETRLWYAVFLPLVGLLVFIRWKYKWLLTYSLVMGSLFLGINYLNPETYDKNLMPALQSIWFIPHVIVYMFAYAFLAASGLVAFKTVWIKNSGSESGIQLPLLADNLVYLGFSFLTMGLLFGALWAKEAWGHYWTWDPKETWAFISWAGYLVYVHYRYSKPKQHQQAMWILLIAIGLLMICWFGVNYLPSARNSVHTYSG